MHSCIRSQLVFFVIASLLVGSMFFSSGCKVVKFFAPAERIELASVEDGSVTGAPLPIDSASTRGLEIRLWVVDDTTWDATRLLNSYQFSEDVVDENSSSSHQSPFQSKDLLDWREWGYRIVAIPVDEVQGFLDQLTPVQTTKVQWLGEFAQWRPIVRAGSLSSSYVRVDDQLKEIELGRPSMIARSWIEPDFTSERIGAVVRLELGMQIENSSRTRGNGFYTEPQSRVLEENGQVIDDLLMSLRLDGSQAVVIVGESPDMDWGTIPDLQTLQTKIEEPESQNRKSSFGPSETDQSSTESDDALSDTSSRSENESISRSSSSNREYLEPSVPIGSTLGELMLTSPGSRISQLNKSRKAPIRVVVVFIPRLEGGFSILPRSENNAQEESGL
ncbi:MAG: hypothetical protein P1U42_01025 [Phycisphaerales bacterium]|nr:hypothetical protein [Phycisphaerales bacterium]